MKSDRRVSSEDFFRRARPATQACIVLQGRNVLPTQGRFARLPSKRILFLMRFPYPLLLLDNPQWRNYTETIMIFGGECIERFYTG